VSDLKNCLVSALIALFATMAGAAAQESGTPRDGTVYNAWNLTCQMNEASGGEVCAMRQQLADNSGNPILLAAVGRNLDTNTPALLMILPLNISLTEGVRLKVDDREPIRIPVERCVPQGCRVEGRIEPDLLEWLKAGNVATVSFVIYDNRDQRRGIEADLSLSGFTLALNEVMR
jgi:invasion protein IalB